MRMTTLALAATLLAVNAQDKTNAPPARPKLFEFGETWSKPFEMSVRTLRVVAINKPCPECTGPEHPNHHEIHVDWMMHYDLFYRPVIAPDHTNQVFVGYGPTNYFVATNVVLKPAIQAQQQGRTSPGWKAEPTPPTPLP